MDVKLSYYYFIFQILGALGPLLLTVNTGMISGYSAVLLPQLNLKNSTSFEIDTAEASWIGKEYCTHLSIFSVIMMIIIIIR